MDKLRCLLLLNDKTNQGSIVLMVYNQENLIANAIGKNPSNQCAGPASLPTRV